VRVAILSNEKSSDTNDRLLKMYLCDEG
jgi:hypothetical protein